jgi:hypothetical protein
VKHLLTSTSVALAGAPLYGQPLLYYCFTTALLLLYWGLAGAPFTGILLRYYCFTTALLGAHRGPFYWRPTALLLLYYCIIGGSQGPLLRAPPRCLCCLTTALLPLYYCFTNALLGARRTPFMGTTALPLPLRLPLPLLPHPQRIHV